MNMPMVAAPRRFRIALAIGTIGITSALSAADSTGVPDSAIALGLKAPTPKLVISDPTRNLPPYVPPAPPKPLSKTTLVFSDFTPYVSSGTTQGWQQGSSPKTILIPSLRGLCRSNKRQRR